MNSDKKHLEQLLDAYFHQSLDEVAREDLNQQLIASASARSIFWQRVAMENSLECWAEKEHGGVLALKPVTASAAADGASGTHFTNQIEGDRFAGFIVLRETDQRLRRPV